jgi:hypothetical protein
VDDLLAVAVMVVFFTFAYACVVICDHLTANSAEREILDERQEDVDA